MRSGRIPGVFIYFGPADSLTGETGSQPADGSAGCCGTGVDQPVLISDDSLFPTANLKT